MGSFLSSDLKMAVNIDQVVAQSGMDQLSAKSYLQNEVFPKLESALNILLETIEKNGEFENYVEMLAEREERERKDLRKRERERDRLADGDAVISEEDDDEEEEQASDWSNTSSDPENSDNVVSDFHVTVNNDNDKLGGGLRAPGTPSVSAYGRKKALSKASMDDAHRFNALRFLALNLMSLNDTLKH